MGNKKTAEGGCDHPTAAKRAFRRLAFRPDDILSRFNSRAREITRPSGRPEPFGRDGLHYTKTHSRCHALTQSTRCASALAQATRLWYNTNPIGQVCPTAIAYSSQPSSQPSARSPAPSLSLPPLTPPSRRRPPAPSRSQSTPPIQRNRAVDASVNRRRVCAGTSAPFSTNQRRNSRIPSTRRRKQRGVLVLSPAPNAPGRGQNAQLTARITRKITANNPKGGLRRFAYF